MACIGDVSPWVESSLRSVFLVLPLPSQRSQKVAPSPSVGALYHSRCSRHSDNHNLFCIEVFFLLQSTDFRFQAHCCARDRPHYSKGQIDLRSPSDQYDGLSPQLGVHLVLQDQPFLRDLRNERSPQTMKIRRFFDMSGGMLMK